jgi:hypothetical protein
MRPARQNKLSHLAAV